MSFADLPPLPPLIHPAGAAYAHRINERTREAQGRGRVVLDVAYGPDYWQKLDIYLPHEVGLTALPVLCFLHGGAWVNGCKEWMGFMAPPIVAAPAIFVSASYRHAPAARFPKQLEDTVEAVAWLYRNIASHGGDPTRILLGGHSSGAHLAALATLRRDVLASRGLPENCISGCLPVSAPFDLSSDDPVRRKKVLSFLERADDIAAASPIRHVSGNRTPFLIAYGGDDLPELVPQASAMYRALKEQGNDARLLKLDGCSHFDTSERCVDDGHPWLGEVLAWLGARRAKS